MSIRLPALNLLQQPGEWAVNSPLGATFPGDDDYNEQLARAKSGTPAIPPKPSAPAGTAAKEETMSEWWNRITNQAIPPKPSAPAGTAAKEETMSEWWNRITNQAKEQGAFSSMNYLGVSSPMTKIVVIVLGLICIAAGLMMFKPVREVVIDSAKTAATVAA